MRHAIFSSDMIEIAARKWFDKVNGNTYHSVVIYVQTGESSETLKSSPLVYGYGDSWKQTACELLKKNGYKLSTPLVKKVNKAAGYDILRSTEFTYDCFFGLKKYGRMMQYNVVDNCLKRELKELVS